MNREYIGINEARPKLGDLVTAVQQGAEIVITRNGKPAALITRYQEDTMTVTVDLASTDRAAYLAETIRTESGGTRTATVDGATVTLDRDALDVLADLANDSDGHYDGRHIWIGGSEYEVTPVLAAGNRVNVARDALPEDWTAAGEIIEVSEQTVTVELDNGHRQEVLRDQVTPA